MAKIIKNASGNFLIVCFIFALVVGWIFSGWPRIWPLGGFDKLTTGELGVNKIRIPPKIQEAQAATTGNLVPVLNGGVAGTGWLNTGGTQCAVDGTNCYTEVDDTPGSHDGDTTHIRKGTEVSGLTTTFNLNISSIPDSSTITQINITFVCRRTATAASNMQSVRRIDGALTAFGTDVACPNNTTYVGGTFTQSHTSLSITKTASTDLEVGVRSTSAKAVYVTSIYAAITYTPPSSITAPSSVAMPNYTLGSLPTGYSEIDFSDVVQVTAYAGFTVTVSSTNLTGGGNTILASSVKLRTDGNIENNPTRIPSASCSGFTPTEPATNEYALDTAKNVVTATVGAGGTCNIYPTIKVYISNNLKAAQVTGTLTFTVQ
jgi:hypothetical protein